MVLDDSHYLKRVWLCIRIIFRMARRLAFNTNKKSGTPKMDVLKEKKDDPENPFLSSYIKRFNVSFYDDPKGNIQILKPVRNSLCPLSRK